MLNPVNGHLNDISVHRLVQAVSRTPAVDEDDPYQPLEFITAAQAEAVKLLGRALPPAHVHESSEMAKWNSLTPHIDALFENTNKINDTIDVAHLFVEAGDYLSAQGSGKYALKYLLRAQSYFRSARSGDRYHEVKVRQSLADAYRAAGDRQRALMLYDELLKDSLTDPRYASILKTDHLLVIMNDMGLSCEEAGDHKKAREIYELIRPLMMRRFGDHDRRTLTTSNNLAQVYSIMGLPGRALPLFEQVLAGRRATLGDEHVETLVTSSNLAHVRGQVTGNWARAVEDLEAVLSDFERLYGVNYLPTVITRGELALALHYAGRLFRTPYTWHPSLCKKLVRFRRLAERGNQKSNGSLEQLVPTTESATPENRCATIVPPASPWNRAGSLPAE